MERNGTQGHFLLLKMAFKSRVIPLKSMVSNIEWKIDSGCCPFLITTGGGESVQHIFTLRPSFSLGTAQIRTKQVPNYLDLLTHRQCWIKACYRRWSPHQPKSVCPISLPEGATQQQGCFDSQCTEFKAEDMGIMWPLQQGIA